MRKLLIVGVAGLAWWGLATLAYELMSQTTPKCPDSDNHIRILLFEQSIG
jgi:hypothetical protein